MRWESNTEYLRNASAQPWSKRSDGNFGGRSILESNVYGNSPRDEYLSHHGIPGMKWGVITKEYIKKGYNTIARRQAILKRKRQAKAKEENKKNFNEGYEQGRRAAANTYFIKKRVGEVLERKQKEQEGSFTDRLVKKGLDKALKNKDVNDLINQANEVTQNFGIDAKKMIREQGAEYLIKAKDFGIDKLYDWASGENGQKNLVKVADFLGRAASGTIGVGRKAAPYVAKGARATARAAGTGMKRAGKYILKSAKTSYHWLHTGKPTGAQKIRNAANKIGSTLNRGVNKGFDILDQSAKTAHLAAKLGHENLKLLLNRRPTRRRG